MGKVIAFPGKKPPHLDKQLDQWLAQGQWEAIADQVRSGLPWTTLVRGYPLLGAILQAHAHLNPSTQPPMASPLPPVLEELLDDIPCPTGVLPGQAPMTAIAWAATYGHWHRVLQWAKQGWQIDTLERNIWILMIEGHIARWDGPPSMTLELPLCTKPLPAQERAWCERVMAELKDQTPSWPGHDHGCNRVLTSALVVHHTDMLEMLLAAGVPANLDCTNDDEDVAPDDPPLLPAHVALHADNPQALEKLITDPQAWQCPPTHTTMLQESLLDLSIKMDSPRCMWVLLKKWPPKVLMDALPNAMVHAITSAKVDAMEALHEYGAPLHWPTQDQYTLLHQAAIVGDVDVINWLLDHGLDWDTPASNGLTAWQLLSQSHPQLLKHWHRSKDTGGVSLLGARPRRS